MWCKLVVLILFMTRNLNLISGIPKQLNVQKYWTWYVLLSKTCTGTGTYLVNVPVPRYRYNFFSCTWQRSVQVSLERNRLRHLNLLEIQVAPSSGFVQTILFSKNPVHGHWHMHIHIHSNTHTYNTTTHFISTLHEIRTGILRFELQTLYPLGHPVLFTWWVKIVA